MNKEVYPIVVPTRSSLKSFNFYLLKNEDGLTLIDAGVNTTKCWDYCNEALRKNGFSLEHLDRILVTHNHEDHVGLVNRIVAEKDIPVSVPENSIHRLKREKSFFQMRIEFFAQLYKEMGCGAAGEEQVQKLQEAFNHHAKKKLQTDITPIQPDTLSTIKPIATPGHSPDHMIFYHSEGKSIFSGDLLRKHISSNALVEPDREGNRIKTVIELEASLKRCADVEADLVNPGHGDLIFPSRFSDALQGNQIPNDLRHNQRKLTLVFFSIHRLCYITGSMKSTLNRIIDSVCFSPYTFKPFMNEFFVIQRSGVWRFLLKGT